MGVTSVSGTGSSSVITAKVVPASAVKASTPAYKTIGTTIGDIGRGVVKDLTGGHFGNGNAAKQSGETQSEYLARLAQAAGAAAQSFDDSVKTPASSNSAADAFKAGVTNEAVTNAITKFLPIIGIGVGGFFIIKMFISKKGGKPRY